MLPKVPTHVVIIPDGNRRWAKNNNLPPLFGHEKGYERANELISFSKENGIKYLTLWAFSTENWNRSESEVKDLLRLIEKGLKELKVKVEKEDARFIHIGRKDRLGENVLDLIDGLEKSTKDKNSFTLILAIDYGGEDEVRRAEELLKEDQNKEMSLFDYLDTSRVGIPNPDFIIRTSGERRTSGFMPLQSLYSEWHFDDRHFPDFDINAFTAALTNFSLRERRFGA